MFLLFGWLVSCAADKSRNVVRAAVRHALHVGHDTVARTNTVLFKSYIDMVTERLNNEQDEVFLRPLHAQDNDSRFKSSM